MKSPAYYAGIAVGFGVVIILFIIILFALRKKNPKPEYDEMQIAARGKAFKSGFFSLLIANMLCMGISTAEISWLPVFFIFTVGSLAGITVFIISAIKNDAYFGLNENRRSSSIFIGAMGLLNLVIGVVNISLRGVLKDGELNMAFLNIMVFVLSVVILLAALIHGRKSSALENERDV